MLRSIGASQVAVLPPNTMNLWLFVAETLAKPKVVYLDLIIFFFLFSQFSS